MRNANEMRTIANRYNAQFDITNADAVIEEVLECKIEVKAKYGETTRVVTAEELIIPIKTRLAKGNEIVNRHRYSGILAEAKKILEANGYEAEINENNTITINW